MTHSPDQSLEYWEQDPDFEPSNGKVTLPSLTQQPTAAPTVPLLFTPTRPPHAHQWESLRRARGKRSFAYLHEMGAGKSKILIDELSQLYLEGVVDRMLVVAGSGSYEDWISKHVPENLPEEIHALVHLWQGGSSKTEQLRLNSMMNGPPMLRILAINIEGLGSSERAAIVAQNFVRGGKALFAVDEASKIKNESAHCNVVATRIGRDAVVLRTLTGSPITKSPLDIWGQMKFLGVEQDFASNYYAFRARFCTTVDIRAGLSKRRPGDSGPPKSRTIKKVTGYQNLDRLTRVLEQHSHRVLKEDCLDLPPKIYQVHRVPLTDEQRRLYRQMAQVATAEIHGGVWSSAKNAMGILAKLHQIVLGHIVDESGEVHGIETLRPAALCDLVEEAGDKVIVWCAYRRDVTLVLQELARRFPTRWSVRYDGLATPDARATAKVEFQEGNAHCFVGTAATGGYGVTLTASATTIYYSNSHNLDHRVQSEDRSHRDGQTRAVTYVDMISPRTVEERIVKLLREKKNISDTVTGDGAREWLSWMDD